MRRCESQLQDLRRRRSHYARRPTTLTLSAMARPISCACTILPIGSPFAAGLRCWPSRNITAASRCPEIDDCAALAALCLSRGSARARCRLGARDGACPLRLRRATFSSINIRYTPLGSGAVPGARRELCSSRPSRRRLRAVRRCRDVVAAQHVFGRTQSCSRSSRRSALLSPGSRERMPFHAMIFSGRSQVEPGSEQYRRLSHWAERQLPRRDQAAVDGGTSELSRRALAAGRVESRVPRRLSLEHPARRGMMARSSAKQILDD